jgi:exosortase A-associated hydrolase 2
VAGIEPRPRFIAGSAGQLFLNTWQLSAGPIHGFVLIVPPFAEEMNRSRRMFGLVSQGLARCGLAAATLDLFGTGDSHGGFGEARIEIWLDDLKRALVELESAYGACRGIIATRFGALLSLHPDVATNARAERVVLWQPVTRGELLFTQFLRLRSAAGLRATDPAKRENVAQARARLANGEALEVAGYVIAPELARDIDALALVAPGLQASGKLNWFDIGTARDQLGKDGERAVGELRSAGYQVEIEFVDAPQFWALPETTIAPELLVRTAALFDAASP